MKALKDGRKVFGLTKQCVDKKTRLSSVYQVCQVLAKYSKKWVFPALSDFQESNWINNPEKKVFFRKSKLLYFVRLNSN